MDSIRSIKRSGLKQLVALLFSVIALSGCLQSEEHITIKFDGSGTVETHLVVPPETLQLVDAMLGGMVKAFQAMTQEPGKAAAQPAVSVAEQMFGSREEIEKKIKESGVQATLESFKTEKKEDGLNVFYTIKTTDISALARTPVMVTKLKIMQNDTGNWFCRPIADKKVKEKSQDGQAKLEEFKNSHSFMSMPEARQIEFTKAMLNFRAEAQITFPGSITEVGGIFQKKDDETAVVAVTTDMVTNPLILAKWEKLKDASIARTGSGPVPSDFLAPLPEEEEEGAKKAPVATVPPSTAAPAVAADKVGNQVKVFLKDGKVAEGKLLESSDGEVKIDFQGVTLTYYKDEFEKVE